MTETATKKNLRPLGNRVLVRPKEVKEQVRASGLVVIEQAQEKPNEGTVVAVGTGTRGDDGKVYPLNVKMGDYILYGKYSGSDITVNGEKLLVMPEEDILGVLE